VIIEPRFSPDRHRQINDLPPAEVLAKDRRRRGRDEESKRRGDRNEEHDQGASLKLAAEGVKLSVVK
jgi:hypothetical protein